MEKSTHKYIYWVLGVLLAVTLIVASYQYRRAGAMQLAVENNYNRAFHELVDYTDDVNTLLKKAVIVSSPAQIASISTQLFRETTAAKACLAQLPISEVPLEKTEKFLSQIGDYTYALSQKAINGEEISEEDYENLSKLGDYADSLKEELLSMQQDIYSGNISFGEIKEEGDVHLANTALAADGDIMSDFSNMEKQFQEYPSLIYDGPFSEHIERMNPLMLENARSFTEAEALEKAKNILGTRAVNLYSDGESQNTSLESFLFRGDTEDMGVYAAITKKGGFPLYFLVNREIGEEKITVENAINRARSFLYEIGFASMKNSYYDKANGVATINFAYEQGNVTCYSDLIKVKVALDDGEIIGLETNGYLMSHTQRNIESPQISEEEARSKVSKHLEAESISLALIPKESKKEVFCYEISGKHKDNNFLMYINAENGREEQILMLIESENGILTV